MSEKETVKEILSSALDADEQGDKEKAVEFYTKAVETILKISDPAVRERLNKYAVQALDRAEELRGISSPTHKTKTTNVDESHANHLQVQSNLCVPVNLKRVRELSPNFMCFKFSQVQVQQGLK